MILALFGGLVLRPSIRGNDGVGHFVYLASVFSDGDLDFTDEYAQFDQSRGYDFKFAELPASGRTGRPSNRYGIGAALLWSPFVAVAYLTAPAGNTGVERPYEWAVGIASMFWASLGLALLYGWLRRYSGRLACGATLAGLILATPLGFYMYAHGSMSHAVSFFAMTLALLAFDRAWHQPRPWAMFTTGAVLALVFIIRFQDATWTLLLGLTLAVHWARLPREKRGAMWRGWVALVAGGLLVLLPQMITWQILYGSFLSGPTPYLNDSAGSFSLMPRHAFAVLFSERGGVLAWHPLLLAGLTGLALIVTPQGKKSPLQMAAWIGLAGFAAQWWLISCWSFWWAGASFGNRFFISALPFMTLGITRLFERADGKPPLTRLALLAILVLWNFGLLIQYATQMVPREDPISWGQVVSQNLFDVPRWLLQKLIGN